MRTGSLAHFERAHLRRVRLRPLARLPQPARPQTHRPNSRSGVPRLLAPHRLGTNLRASSGLFHASLFRLARTARIPRRPGSRMPHLQAPTSRRGRGHFRCHAPMESDSRRTAFSPTQLAAAMALLRPRPASPMDTNALQRHPASFRLLEPKPYQTHSLRTFWTMLLPWPSLSLALYIVTALTVRASLCAAGEATLSCRCVIPPCCSPPFSSLPISQSMT